jgi:hypothetical protein
MMHTLTKFKARGRGNEIGREERETDRLGRHTICDRERDNNDGDGEANTQQIRERETQRERGKNLKMEIERD